MNYVEECKHRAGDDWANLLAQDMGLRLPDRTVPRWYSWLVEALLGPRVSSGRPYASRECFARVACRVADSRQTLDALETLYQAGGFKYAAVMEFFEGLADEEAQRGL